MARMIRKFWAAKAIGQTSTSKCVTYSYWHDLKTDIRKPKSWQDAANMVLRRFRLILVKNIDGDRAWWCLRGWLGLVDQIHKEGNCKACKG